MDVGALVRTDVDVSVRKQVLHRGTVADGHKLERDAVVECLVTLDCRKHEILDAARKDVVLQPHLSLHRAPGLTETTGDALFRRKERSGLLEEEYVSDIPPLRVKTLALLPPHGHNLLPLGIVKCWLALQQCSTRKHEITPGLR